MLTVTNDIIQQDYYLLFIHTPLCGTCSVARAMLEKIESVHGQNIFYNMNASLNPEYMQSHKVESVPCLLIKEKGVVQEKVYAFQSIGNIYMYLSKYKPDLFVQT